MPNLNKAIAYACILLTPAFLFAQKYTIEIEITDSTSGKLSFSPADILDQPCWFAATTPIERGKTYTGAATRMDTKKDSVTKENRPGIFIKEFGERGIFIHEGKDVSWSENCIVLKRDKMMELWNHIVANGDKDNYVIEIVIKD